MSGSLTGRIRAQVGTACAVGLMIALLSSAMPSAAFSQDVLRPVVAVPQTQKSVAHRDIENIVPKTPGAPSGDEEHAKQVLAAEGSNIVVLHPLQAAAPDYNIVVCEAGCGAQGPHIVYKIAKTLIRSVALDAKLARDPALHFVPLKEIASNIQYCCLVLFPGNGFEVALLRAHLQDTAALEEHHAAQCKIKRSITMMGDQREVLELFIAHQLGTREIAHVHDIGFKELVQWPVGIAVDDAGRNRELLHRGQAMGQEPPTTQVEIDIPQRRLILVERYEGHLRLNRDRLR